MKKEILISKRLILIILAVAIVITICGGWGAVWDVTSGFISFCVSILLILFAAYGINTFIDKFFKKKNTFHIKYCVAYVIEGRDKDLTDYFQNFEDREKALSFYESLLLNSALYTANFCEVIETTG